MIQAWRNMWGNIFNYTGTVGRKEYWLALLANVIAMYIFAVPYALILVPFTQNVGAAVAVYLIAINLPAVALYVRRANDVCWKKGSTLLAAVAAPCVSAIVVGMLPTLPKEFRWSRKTSVPWLLFAVGFGLCIYGDMLGVVVFDSVEALAPMMYAGLALNTLTLITVGILNRKMVVQMMREMG